MHRQIGIETEQELWRVTLKELKDKTGMTSKQIADKENLSEKTVARVFSGEAKSPGVDLVRRIIHALGGTWSEIFAESGAVIGGQDLAILQNDVNRLSTEVEQLNAEIALLTAENKILKDKNATLSAETDLLRLKLEHKEEIISLHNYYNKLKQND